MQKWIIMLIAFAAPVFLLAQPEVEKKRETFPFKASDKGRMLVVENIWGDIEVEGYDGDEIVIETTRTIDARTAQGRDKIKQSVKSGMVNLGDAVLLYLDHPCKNFDEANLTREKIWEGSWNNWSNQKCSWDLEKDFSFRLDYKIKVPKNCDVKLSTVNESNIRVTNIRGRQNLCNVNGNIALDRVTGPSMVRTINGDVTIHYDRNPEEESSYYTLNGVINAYFKPDLSAQCFFKTFSGEFYTDLENVTPIPTTVEKSSEDGQFKYANPGGSAFRTGSGKTKLKFETFNGDVYLRTKG